MFSRPLCALVLLSSVACSSTIEPAGPSPSGTTTGPLPTATSTVPSTPAGPKVIGAAGIAAWDAVGDKDAVKTFPSLYLHQSVGQDLEDGAKSIGFPFEYYGPNQSSVANGLNGGIFTDVGPVDNGKPLSKMNVVRREFQKHKGRLKVMSFSFGYADVLDSVDDAGRTVTLPETLAEYKKLVDEVKAAGIKFVHITPPLVFDPSTNAPKMQMRSYMIDTFKDDFIFDLTDIESMDGGARCEKGGVWHICQANRSTAECPSVGQGVDGDGQGHLCSKKAALFSKALLYAFHSAAK